MVFTGIIRNFLNYKLDGSNLWIYNIPYDIIIGDSIAINGVCLTVTEKGTNYYKFS